MAGNLVHFEIPAEDAARAKTFWTMLFGWQFRPWTGPVEYHMFESSGGPGGAIYPAHKRDGHMILYFDVEDIDTALDRVDGLGGSIIEGKSAIPGVGWFARCLDTEGTAFSLFESDESVPMPAA